MERGKTRASDNEGIKREKVKKREKKMRGLTLRERERERVPKKFCFPRLQIKIIFIGIETREREIVF